MVYRIAGGAFFILLAIQDFGLTAIPVLLLGVLAFVAGIALIAGQ